MRSETVFKQTFNRTMDYLSTLEPRSTILSENVLTRKLQASRTTVRKVLDELHNRRILNGFQHLLEKADARRSRPAVRL